MKRGGGIFHDDDFSPMAKKHNNPTALKRVRSSVAWSVHVYCGVSSRREQTDSGSAAYWSI